MIRGSFHLVSLYFAIAVQREARANLLTDFHKYARRGLTAQMVQQHVACVWLVLFPVKIPATAFRVLLECIVHHSNCRRYALQAPILWAMSAIAHPALLAPFQTKVQLGVFYAEQVRFANHYAMHTLPHLKCVVPECFHPKEPVSALSAAMAHTLPRIPALVISVLVVIPVLAQKAQLSVPKGHIRQGQFHSVLLVLQARTAMLWEQLSAPPVLQAFFAPRTEQLSQISA